MKISSDDSLKNISIQSTHHQQEGNSLFSANKTSFATFKMDSRLFESALTGNIDGLHRLLRENPLLFHTISLYSNENPLHIASGEGHVGFVREILRLKPELAKEVNADAFSPLHVAAANGHVEIVRELMNVDPRLCIAEGREKKTAFHFAAMKGRVGVINEILGRYAECIESVTVQKETALHLAIKNSQFEAIKVMVDWILRVKKEEILNLQDEQGNTVLHLAAWRKQRQASIRFRFTTVLTDSRKSASFKLLGK